MQRPLYFTSELDSSFAAFLLNVMPLAVIIVDNEVRVQVINEAAQGFFCTSGEESYLQKCGSVFKCINVWGLGECGGCIACSKCILRKSVLETLEGRTVSRNKGSYDVVLNGEVKRLTLLVTASPIVYEKNRMVIVLIEDVSLITKLEGLIPICSVCHRIRDDQEEWIDLEKYLMKHSEAELTHDFCPVCSNKMHAKYVQKKG